MVLWKCERPPLLGSRVGMECSWRALVWNLGARRERRDLSFRLTLHICFMLFLFTNFVTVASPPNATAPAHQKGASRPPIVFVSSAYSNCFNILILFLALNNNQVGIRPPKKTVVHLSSPLLYFSSFRILRDASRVFLCFSPLRQCVWTRTPNHLFFSRFHYQAEERCPEVLHFFFILPFFLVFVAACPTTVKKNV